MTLAFAWDATFRPFGGVLLLAIAASAARAQDSTRTRSCDGKTVNAIHVNAHRPPFKGEIAYWQRVARQFGLHHTTTDTLIIRRFLALETGDKCSDFRVRESARLLRAQPYLTDVSVKAIPDSVGGVTIEVQTTDEISAIAAVSVEQGHLSYLEIGNENLYGQALLLAIHGANGVVAGQSAGVRATDYQFLKKPYQLDVQANWGLHTSSWLIDAFHAYLTDLQRVAWEIGIAHTNPQFIELSRGEGLDDLVLEFRNLGADVGGIVKLGNLKTPFLIGGVLTLTRREVVGGLAVTDHGLQADTTLASSYPRVSRARFAGIGAWRNLNFITVNGFNSLAGTEDEPTGAQLFGQLGRGTHSLSGASDVYTLGDVLAGVGSGKSYAEVHLISEARKQLGIARWDGVVTGGLFAVYLKPNELNLLRGWGAFAGGWRIQSPFQLGLNEENQRLLGYHGALFGGRRVALGLLARHIVPGVTPRGDVAFGAFVDAARLWAGDAPFGMNTPLLPSVGLSLFAATPKGSQRTLRIDFGTALRTGIPRSGWEVRLIYSDFTRTVLTEPGDILGAREQLIGPNVFRP